MNRKPHVSVYIVGIAGTTDPTEFNSSYFDLDFMKCTASSSFFQRTVGLRKYLMASFQLWGFPGLTAASLEDVTVHMQPTKQRAMLVLLSVEGSVQITIDVEPRVLSKCCSSQSHPCDLPITRICVFNEILF